RETASGHRTRRDECPPQRSASPAGEEFRRARRGCFDRAWTRCCRSIIPQSPGAHYEDCVRINPHLRSMAWNDMELRRGTTDPSSIIAANGDNRLRRPQRTRHRMDPGEIYAKTEEGLRELKERKRGLPITLRGLLIMVDGTRTVA